jgi:hypothetical protein
MLLSWNSRHFSLILFVDSCTEWELWWHQGFLQAMHVLAVLSEITHLLCTFCSFNLETKLTMSRHWQTVFLLCKIWGFHGGDYDDYHLLGDDTVSPTSLCLYKSLQLLSVTCSHSCTLKMEAIRSSETSVLIRPTRCHLPEDDNHQFFCCLWVIGFRR